MMFKSVMHQNSIINKPTRRNRRRTKMVTKILSVTTLFILVGCVPIETKLDKVLQRQIETAVENFQGDVGIYVRHLSKNITAGINENDLFPTASMIKVPILIKIFDKIEKGELIIDSTVIYYKDSINYQWKGDDAISRFKDGEDISIGKLMAHMITFSDNHAGIWLQELAGSGTEINEWLNREGFQFTRVNSRTIGREDDYEQYGWGQTTPREMAELLVIIREGRAVSKRASDDMYRYLTRIYWDGNALSQIPPTIQVASKQGALDQSRSEVVLVNAPHGDYVFCIITKNQKDMSWSISNEGSVLIKTVSNLLWNYFEPDFGWKREIGIMNIILGGQNEKASCFEFRLINFVNECSMVNFSR